MMKETIIQKTKSEVLVRIEDKKLLSLRLFYYPSRKYANHAEYVVELRGRHLIATVLDHGWHISDIDVRRYLRWHEAEELRARMLQVTTIAEFGKLFNNVVGVEEFEEVSE